MDSSKVAVIVGQGQGVLSVRQDASVLHACKKMRRHNVGCLVVVDKSGRTVGILTERDLVYRTMAEGRNAEETLVLDVMTAEFVSIDPTTAIPAAQALMARNRVRHLPVLDDGLLVGVISSRDILAYQVDTVRNVLRAQMDLLHHIEGELPQAEWRAQHQPPEEANP